MNSLAYAEDYAKTLFREGKIQQSMDVLYYTLKYTTEEVTGIVAAWEAERKAA